MIQIEFSFLTQKFWTQLSGSTENFCESQTVTEVNVQIYFSLTSFLRLDWDPVYLRP